MIEGLQSYLSHVKKKADQETGDYNALLRDREDLMQSIADLEKDREELLKTEAQVAILKQVSYALFSDSCL